MNYRIAITDDSAADTAYAASLTERWADAAGCTVTIETFPSAEAFLCRWAENPPFDLLLLDIEMPGLNGIELAKTIRSRRDPMQIILITGYPDFMSEGYDVAALHYLMKPVSPDKLSGVLDRAASAIGQASPAICLRSEGETVRIRLREITYAESAGHDIRVHTTDRILTIRMTITGLAEELGESFVRCHRTLLVNLATVARLSKNEVILDDGTVLPLARNASAAVHQAFIRYYTKGEDAR